MPPTEEDLAWFRSTFRPIPKAALPDDCVEYSLYVIDASFDASNDSETRLRLREAQKYASELQKEWLKDYIWQRQGFSLEVAKEDGEVCMPNYRSNRRSTNALLVGVSVLRGRTEYGDSVEDEWVVVWLLREITKKFKELWVKVSDNDGEFLLIEASGTIPAWLEPEVAGNRIWIHDGDLNIIKPADAARSSRRTTETLTLEEARKVILRDPKRLMHSSIIEAEAFYRIRDYPGKIKQNMHHALVTIPRKVAYLLGQKPAYIASATEAFYLRDPIALKPLHTAKANVDLIFPPVDLVTVSLRLPRIGYAQIKSQDFLPPGIWKAALHPKDGKEAFNRAESGMKVSCGFEMLLSDQHYQDKPSVREMKMLLEDLDTGDEKLPSDDEIKQQGMREDDESWLDISYDDLEAELDGKQKGQPGRKKTDFGDKAAQENLQRIVKQFESFLGDDKAGFDGAGMFDEDSDDDLDDSDDSDDEVENNSGEDKEASFNEDEFTAMMREMMGIPAEVMNEIMTGKVGGGKGRDAERTGTAGPSNIPGMSRVQELDSNGDEVGDEGMQNLMRRMEAELKESGALNLDSSIPETGATRRAVNNKRPKSANDESIDESDDDEENDVDINLARNLLESFKSQAGMAGPSGNMMGMMGLGLPRDEVDEDLGTRGKAK